MGQETEIIKTVLPWIGTAIGGPLAPIVATLGAKLLGVDSDKVESTIKELLPTTEGKIKVLELESQVQIELQRLGYASLESLNAHIEKASSEVNETMRAETTAEHWPQYTWRPFNGFLFGITIFCSYFLLPLLGKPIPTIPEFVWISWGGILGLASFFRGKMQADPQIPISTKLTKPQ